MTSTRAGDARMTVESRHQIEVTPATSVIGAYVTNVDLRAPLAPEAVAAISGALARWKVLFFRDQPISGDDHLRFASYFGQPTTAHPVQRGGAERREIFVVESTAARVQFGHDAPQSRFAPPRRTETHWHTDITFVANPASASILRGAVIPAHGGDTLWTNLVIAYQELSPSIRELVDHLQAVHRWHGYDGETRGDYDPSSPPSAVHPVVRVHPVTGERALFVNPVFTRYIVGLTDRESRQILELLFDQIARPEFGVRFHWETDSIAFWDNQATAHVGPVDLGINKLDRRVERVTLAGEVPIGPDGFRSVPLVGDLFS